MSNELFISVIVPVYNGSRTLAQCLDGIKSSSYGSFEIIVVDDGSTDESAEIARAKGVTVLTMPFKSGPAGGRNYGAERARGDVLLFVDADVVITKETLSRVVLDFEKAPSVAAVFGSYDDRPAEKNFLSQYKNLQHHFVHQQANDEAVTFWAGCGAIRREVFLALGGFDAARYPEPSIEDIELGYRLRRNGHRILLDKSIQAKHLKEWRLTSWLRADIFYRTIPWSRLILEDQVMVNDLNLHASERMSAGLVGLLVCTISLSILEPQALYVASALLLILIILNHKLYSFFFDRKGPLFLALAVPVHLLYFLYSGITFAVCWASHVLAPHRSGGARS